VIAEFRAFLLKTNALALAIGVIIGAALGAVVTSLVKDVIMPPIGYALGGVDFAAIKTVLKPAAGSAAEVAINWGVFFNAVIAFVVIAFVVFMVSRSFIKEEPAAPAPVTKECSYCREQVLEAASKCRHCGSAV
jgi:large conductance mechanosensitive channel